MTTINDLDEGVDEQDGAGRCRPDSNQRSIARAPLYEDLQGLRRNRNRRGGSPLCSIPVVIDVVTPILGGSNRTRSIDDVDVIRPATIRGHLRFWWRALYGHGYETLKDLHAAESALWGRAATENDGGRSQVDVRVTVLAEGEKDSAPIQLHHTHNAPETKGSYALWTAKEPPAPRRKPGTCFRLELIAPEKYEGELRNVLRAWLLFGGYGSRTRRGLGCFTVKDNPESSQRAGEWLPREATREALRALFGIDIFVPPARGAQETPMLAGAALYVGNPGTSAETAWTTALGWLKEFRQGSAGPAGGRAREPDPSDGSRPSISNWPEADKVRHRSRPKQGLSWAHPPRHSATPAWPRAGFGLPIIGRFQERSRVLPQSPGPKDPKPLRWTELPIACTEPEGFEIRWRSGGKEHDRLASPLIVKAMPLANGKFVPCALWLNRSLPAGAEVGLARKKVGTQNEKKVDPRSAAPFDRLVAPDDEPRFDALAGKATLREAFLDWLEPRAKQVVP